MNYRIFLIWFLLVVLWNFGFPSAAPIFDVIIAVILSIFVKILESWMR